MEVIQNPILERYVEAAGNDIGNIVLCMLRNLRGKCEGDTWIALRRALDMETVIGEFIVYSATEIDEAAQRALLHLKEGTSARHIFGDVLDRVPSYDLALSRTARLS